MRISDWSSDVCSSDLSAPARRLSTGTRRAGRGAVNVVDRDLPPVRGRVDGAGRLIEADRRLDDLNEAAGGAIGAPLAIPALAELARLVQRQIGREHV